MNQNTDSEFALVSMDILPDSYKKVLDAKLLLAKSKAKNSSEACKMVGISRSVYYKYKDHISLYDHNSKSKVLTLYLKLSDEPGVLSSVLTAISDLGGNIVTVNQNIPAQTVAVVTVSIKLKDKKTPLSVLIDKLSALSGVIEINKI